MLGDWEEHPVPVGLEDMSPRHAPEIVFRPDTLYVRRDEFGVVAIVKLSGYRVIGGHPTVGILDSWEWDRDRDSEVGWVSALVGGLTDG